MPPPTTQDLLAAVQDLQQRFKQRQQPPLPASVRETFRRRVAQTLAYELPLAFLDILTVTDGLDWNGVVLYASETRLRDNDELDIQGLLEANVQLRLAHAPDKDFIYFAESGMEAFRHNLATDQYEISDRVVGTNVYETFETAEALFRRMLEKMLNIGTDEDEELDF